jgi:hypothetical protein
MHTHDRHPIDTFRDHHKRIFTWLRWKFAKNGNSFCVCTTDSPSGTVRFENRFFRTLCGTHQNPGERYSLDHECLASLSAWLYVSTYGAIQVHQYTPEDFDVDQEGWIEIRMEKEYAWK